MIQTRTSTVFDTWTEFVSFSQYGKPYCGDTRASRRVEEGRRIWSGSKDYDEALSLAIKGWPDGTRRALEVSNKLEAKLFNLVEIPVINYDVTGELLDIARFCSGEPEHWGVFDKVLREGKGTKYVYILVNCTFSSGIDKQVVISRGAVVGALINLLELAGCRTKVTVINNIERVDESYRIDVPVKDFDETLDMDRMAYAVSNPTLLRRHMFSVMECIPDCKRIGAYLGYGKPTDVHSNADIYIPMMQFDDPKWSTEAASLEWIVQCLKAQGVLRHDAEVPSASTEEQPEEEEDF